MDTNQRKSTFRQVLFVCGLLMVVCSLLPVAVDGNYVAIFSEKSTNMTEILWYSGPVFFIGVFSLVLAPIRNVPAAILAGAALMLMGAVSFFGVDLLAVLSMENVSSPFYTATTAAGGLPAGRILVVGCVTLSAGMGALKTSQSVFLPRIMTAVGLGFVALYYLLPFVFPAPAIGMSDPLIAPFSHALANGSGRTPQLDTLAIFLSVLCYYAPAAVALGTVHQWWRVHTRCDAPGSILRYAWAVRLIPLVVVLPFAVRFGFQAADTMTTFVILRLYVLFGVAVVVSSTAIQELLTYSHVNVSTRSFVSEMPPTAGDSAGENRTV